MKKTELQMRHIRMLNKGKPMPEERKKKLSESIKRKWREPGFKEKMSKVMRGRKNAPMSEETKRKIGLANKGRKPKWTLESRKKLSEYNKRVGKRPPDPTGRKLSEKTRRKISASHKKLVEQGIHHAWRGGRMNEGKKIRNSWAYREWKRKVKERDVVCVQCGSEKELQADHIKPASKFPELRYDINNGRTLCFPCHRETPTYGANVHKVYT